MKTTLAQRLRKRPQFNEYLLQRANGEWETCHVPTFFRPIEVAAKLPHTLVFLRLRKGWNIFCGSERMDGPCWVFIDEDDYKRNERVDDPHEWAKTHG